VLKVWLALLLVIGSALAVAACGGSGGTTTGSTATEPAPSESTSTTTTPETETTASAEQPWPTVGGNLEDTRFSPASKITTSNANDVKLAWSAGLDPKGVEGSGGEFNPIEVEGVVYSASYGATLGAYDAKTGKAIWQKTLPELDLESNVGAIPTGIRGIAYNEGELYVDMPGGYLTQIDAKTGKPGWTTLINTQEVEGYSTPATVYSNGLVFVGQSGSDIRGGIRAFVKAVDAETGKVVWTFHTLPKPGTPGADTWGAKKELTDGGGATWTNVTVDPETETVYFSTGNPWPDFGRKAGDELYTDGVVGVDEKTGKLKWFFQTTHHDEWDYDCASPPLLWEHEVEGETVKGLSVGCKNGYVYELNRETGKPVTPVKEEPLSNAKTDVDDKAEDEHTFDWKMTGGKPLTEPIPVGESPVTPHCAEAKLLPKKAPDGQPFEDACVYNYYGRSHFVGGTLQDALDWQPASYDPETGDTYWCANNGIRTVKIHNVNAKETDNDLVWPQLYENGEASTEPRTGWLTALNVSNVKAAWQDHYKEAVACTAGSSATAGGLVFTADADGNFMAFNAETGEKVWSYHVKGLKVEAPPIVYTVDGEEYVAVNGTENTTAVLLAFSLGGEGAEPLGTETGKTGPVSGEEVFVQNCGSCHTLAAAGTAGTLGPNLDELAPSESTVEAQVISGGGRMPSFKAQLSKQEIKAVSEYVDKSTEKLK
jgi:quinohemoprotein ethanol dehydrogenase